MAYTYSALIAEGSSISGIEAAATPPTGWLYVVRFAAFTFGSYVGYAQAALGLSDDGPWAWLFSTSEVKILGVRKQTTYWEGRLVVPPERTLYVNVGNPDTMDYIISGYLLRANYAS